MFQRLAAFDIDRSAEAFLETPAESRRSSGILGNLRQLFATNP